MTLFDKMVKLGEFVDSLKLKLKYFPHHRCNAHHTSEAYDELVSNLDNQSIVKKHEFSEKYCQMKDPPPLYPMVVFQKVNEDVRKDHIALFTNDKNMMLPLLS